MNDAVALRNLRESDADEVVSVYRDAFGDARPIDAGEIVSWVRNPQLPPSMLRVLELDGHVVGYGDITVEDDEVSLEVAAPDQWERFLEWAEDVARRKNVSRVRVLSYAGDDLAAAARGRRYRLWRSNYTMRIDLGDTPTEASRLPLGIELRAYEDQDAEILRAVVNEAFADDPFFHKASASHFQQSYLGARGFDPLLWLLAWHADELAGFVLAFPERIGDTNVGSVKGLGVLPRWRGRGIGEALLRVAFRELHDRGLRAVELGVDASNETGAVRLYERVGMLVVWRGDNWVLDI